MKSIPLTQGKFATVDDADFDELSRDRWYFHHTGYAVRKYRRADGSQGMEFMHRRILGLPEQAIQRGDHINRSRLDNRTALATAPTTQCKLCNSSGPDMPCAYPTEINRQQAKRIAELETRLATAPTMSEAVRTLPDRKEVTDPWGYDEGGNYECGYADGWNDCLDEIAEIDRANAEVKS